MLIGYARVSTPDQDLALQMDALNAAGCEHIATDKASGASIDRPGLTEAFGKARKGDTLVIWKLDRFGRTMKGLVDLAADGVTPAFHPAATRDRPLFEGPPVSHPT